MNLRKLLCTFSGDDYSIIEKCSRNLKYRFAIIGLFVINIIFLCFISSYITFTLLFQNKVIGITVAIFFSWMISNIYLLLLYTLTKNVLPHIKNDRARLSSVGIRLIFICFIAVIVSKPVETILFSKQLEKEISDYKKQQIEKYNNITNKFFENQVKDFNKIITDKSKLRDGSNDLLIKHYKSKILEKENERDRLILEMQYLIDNSNYFTHSILIINRKYPLCWLITFICTLIFLIPAYLKNLLREQSNFYSLKKEIESKLIAEEYISFKERYKTILLNQYGVDKSYCESYYDAPFNTKRIIDERVFLKEDDLISEMYDA